MNTFDAICRRRSVRAFNSTAVSDEALSKILLAANAAPVGMGLYENFHLTVIQSGDLLAAIDKAAADMFKDPVGHAHPLYGATTLVLVSMKKPDPAMANSAYSGAASVVQNMSLAATDLGVGMCHIWGAVAALNQHPELVAKLGLPEGFVPCCGAALGGMDEPYAEREIPTDRIATDYIR